MVLSRLKSMMMRYEAHKGKPKADKPKGTCGGFSRISIFPHIMDGWLQVERCHACVSKGKTVKLIDINHTLS